MGLISLDQGSDSVCFSAKRSGQADPASREAAVQLLVPGLSAPIDT